MKCQKCMISDVRLGKKTPLHVYMEQEKIKDKSMLALGPTLMGWMWGHNIFMTGEETLMSPPTGPGTLLIEMTPIHFVNIIEGKVYATGQVVDLFKD